MSFSLKNVMHDFFMKVLVLSKKILVPCKFEPGSGFSL